MAETQAPPVTLLGLVDKHGHQPWGGVLDLVRLGAAVQTQRQQLGVADIVALSRSTALWTALHLRPDIARVLAANGIVEADLRQLLSLDDVPPPASVDDVEVDRDLARALEGFLSAVARPRTVTVVDVTKAILLDVAEHGGLLGRRLDNLGADVAGALRGLDLWLARRGDRPEASEQLLAVSEATGLYLGFYEALRALGMASHALWSAFGLVASRREGTMATVVVRAVLRLRGGPASVWDRSAGLRAFDVVDAVEPVPVEEIDLADHPVLGLAGAVRDRVEPDAMVHLRHVVGVALEAPFGPRGPQTRDRDVEAVCSAFVDQIRRDAPPDVAARWEAYLAKAPVPSPRAVAGVSVDVVDDRTELSDELGVVGDVVTLCDMLASRGAVPPVSVGLFGRWGSGKSYFMALMRRRIDELRNAAVAAGERGEATGYCSEIVQVTFNAWHYMDADDLWATLAVHLFGAIAQVDPDDHRARPRADVVRDLQERQRRMETVDRRITRALGDHRLDEAAQRMGLASTREDVLGLLGEIGTTVGYASAGKVLLTKGRRWSVVALLLGLTGLLAAGTVQPTWLLAWVPLAATLAKWLRGIKHGLAEVNRVAAEAGLQPRDLTAERIANDSEVVRLLDELQAIDRLTSDREWLRERALSSDYTSHFGVISVLRGDLEALVEKQRRDSPDRRIILYIDDLDRCEPSRVVEVLQAVHLLLAFPLFVVVVGVDPRWLLRSLERHYRQVLSTSDGSGPRAVDDLLTESTPHDYLEKIFQIPFSLRPMEADGYGRLVASLAGTPAHPIPVREPEGQTDIRPVTTAPAAGPAPELVQGPAASAPAAAPAPSAGRAEATGLAAIAVNPPQLQVTEAEVAALARMAPLIGTPRAAKRLVNLYRLVRAGLTDAEVERFVAEAQYRSLAIVLAVQVGWARIAKRFLADLAAGADARTITGCVEAVPLPTGADRYDWAALRLAVRSVCVDADDNPVPELDRPIAELRTWIPHLHRYSFEGALS